jgi:hypothetical protein
VTAVPQQSARAAVAQPVVFDALRDSSGFASAATSSLAEPLFGADFGTVRLSAPVCLQPKLKVNAPGDQYEQEAERVADQVMRMPEARIQRKCACGEKSGGGCEECKNDVVPKAVTRRVQRAAEGSKSPGAAPPIVQNVLNTPGQALDTSARAFFEPRFGRDLTAVRVHTDSEAADSASAVNARAYTVGSHIAFASGHFDSNTSDGRKLLAHELAHVVQQQSVLSHGSTVYRQTAPDPVPGSSSGLTILNWPDVLPRAARRTDKDPTRDENIKVQLGSKESKTDDSVAGPFDKTGVDKVWVKGQKKPVERPYVIHAPTLANETAGFVGPLSSEQQALVDEVRSNRESTDAGKLHLNQYQGQYGWQYGGNPKADATPTQVQDKPQEKPDTSTTEGKRKQAEQWIWEELRYEGSSASINAYDSQMVTWGRGLGAVTGGLNPTMTELFKDSAVAEAFLKMGVCFRNNTWMVVNTATGAVETGRNALAIMQADPHILAAMIDIGEGAGTKQQIADAQWKGIKAHGTAQVPDFALDWDMSVLQLVAHITHWGPAYGWHNKSVAKGYEDSGGDPLQVVITFLRAAAGKPNKNGAYSVRKMGPDTIANFGHWGKGIGLQTIKENFKEESLTSDDINTNDDYRGYLILCRGNADHSGQIPCYTYNDN